MNFFSPPPSIFNSTCTSSGLVRCGRRSCIDPCYDEPDTDPGDCLLALPLRYFYNARMGVCRNYTRGCDADSTNDFATAGDCYERCKPSSEFVVLFVVVVCCPLCCCSLLFRVLVVTLLPMMVLLCMHVYAIVVVIVMLFQAGMCLMFFAVFFVVIDD